MNNQTLAAVFYYGSVIGAVVLFAFLVKKQNLKETIFIGLLICAENYTVETIMLHMGYYIYPYAFPGYPDVLIFSSIIFFPIMGMLYYQYLSNDISRNILLTLLFLSINMSSELLGLYSKLFIYQKGLNIGIAFLMYLCIYIVINILKFSNKKNRYVK